MFRPLPTSVLRLGQRRTSQLQLEPLEARRLLAYTSELIADVNAVGADSTTANFVAAAGTVFFHTSHFGHGMELWKTDGSREGTALVKTIEPSGDANIRGMIEFKGKLFLFADDGEHGTELWTSDGTESGTSLFKDIAAGPESSQGRSQLEFPNFTVVGDTLYFTASDMEHGMELWRTDGTSAGTTMVADLHPTGDSRPGGALPEMVALGQQLVFLADDGSHGVEIWTTDGTVIGTTRLTDFPAQGPFGPWPGGLKVLGNQVLFTAPDDAHGYELWATNGTVAGTHLVKDILPGSEGSFPAALGKSAILNGAVVFGARDNEGFGLFRSDGTEAGTYRLKSPFIDARNFVSLGNHVFFVGREGTDDNDVTGHELWVTDGTSAGTQMVADIAPGPGHGVPYLQTMAVLGDRLYFAGAQTETDIELWTSDGTAAGTRRILDINAGNGRGLLYSGSETLYAFNDMLFFAASDGVAGVEPWISDGTPDGTRLLRDVRLGTSSSSPKLWTALGTDQVLFSADDGVHGSEIWRTDGNEQGTALVRDILPGPSQSYLTWSFGKAFAESNGAVYFTAKDDTDQSNGLWRTDGTESGTTEVYGQFGLYPTAQLFTTSGGKLFFRGSGETNDSELWTSDGTVAGTTVVKEIFPGRTEFPLYGSYVNASYPADLVDNHGVLYFAATSENGRELWKSDGTEAGTTQVADLQAGEHDYFGASFGNGSYPKQITPLANGQLFFSAATPENGRELWTSDGTAAGTHLVKDLVPGGGPVSYGGPVNAAGGGDAPNSSNPIALTAVESNLYFLADDGIHGYELWTTDGTDAGTRLVKDIQPGSAEGVSPVFGFAKLTPYQGKVYFFANDGLHGTELWVSDGTDAGTHLVRDIFPGADSSFNPLSNPFFTGITALDHAIAFRANDGVHGDELWTSDGTAQGTMMVNDLRPGPEGSNPYALANIRGTLYYAADNGLLGSEPYRLVESAPFDFGDSNHDGVFDSSDLVLIFQAGEYEDATDNNSTFEEGDWNGDGDFNTQDLIEAFQLGTYVDHVFAEASDLGLTHEPTGR